MVDKKDITFVVTGRVISKGRYTTERCLNSIRRYYKDSTIILVIWDEDKAEGLTYDKLMVMHDDEVENYTYYLDWSPNKMNKRINSVNKQQKLVGEGISAAQTKFVARVRTDFVFRNDYMLRFYDKWSKLLTGRINGLSVFQDRVLAYRVNMVNPRLHDGHFSYQLSDCFLFGTKKDIGFIFDGHQESVDDINYFAIHHDSQRPNPHGFRHKYTSEQFLCLNIIKKAGIRLNIPKWYCDISDEYIKGSERFFSSNLIIGGSSQIGFRSKFKDFYYRKHYSLNWLLHCYVEYVDGNPKVKRYLASRKPLETLDKIVYRIWICAVKLWKKILGRGCKR